MEVAVPNQRLEGWTMTKGTFKLKDCIEFNHLIGFEKELHHRANGGVPKGNRCLYISP